MVRRQHPLQPTKGRQHVEDRAEPGIRDRHPGRPGEGEGGMSGGEREVFLMEQAPEPVLEEVPVPRFKPRMRPMPAGDPFEDAVDRTGDEDQQHKPPAAPGLGVKQEQADRANDRDPRLAGLSHESADVPPESAGLVVVDPVTNAVRVARVGDRRIETHHHERGDEHERHDEHPSSFPCPRRVQRQISSCGGECGHRLVSPSVGLFIPLNP